MCSINAIWIISCRRHPWQLRGVASAAGLGWAGGVSRAGAQWGSPLRSVGSRMEIRGLRRARQEPHAASVSMEGERA